MKKYLVLLLMVSAFAAHAQIQIGSNEIPSLNRAGKISKSDLESFKKSTTIFTLQFKDYQQESQYQQAISSVWKITPFKIVKPEDLGQYTKDGYSVFTFGGFTVQEQGRDISPSYMHLSYDLWLPQVKKSGKIKQHYLAMIWLSPSNTSIYQNERNSGRRGKDYSQRMLSFMYSDAVFYNWNPGMLKGYLKLVNDRLENNKEQGPYSEYQNDKALAELRKDTLYIPDYVFIKFNPLNGKESQETPDNKDIQENYPFPFRVVSANELNQLILSGNPVKYLVYIKSSTDKFVDIFDGQSGELLYANHSSMSYNFKDKDLKKVAKAVK